MFGSGMLEIATGLIFIYIILSLACTAIQEWIASQLNMRGKTLFEGVKNLLNDPDATGLAHQFFNHGLIDAMSQNASDPAKPNRLPSYVPATTFSLALVDILGAHGVVAAAHGPLLTKAEQADDAFERARAQLQAKPDDAQCKQNVADAERERDNSRNALIAEGESAKQAYDDAVTAAKATPNDGNLTQKVISAKDTMDTATAAVKILDARRAAVKLTANSRNATLITNAANTLEEALAVGRAVAAKVPDPLTNVQHAVERLPVGHTREALLVLIDKSRRETGAIEHQTEAFRKNLENWFNDAMDRVGGWYKRWTRQILLAIAVLAVIAVNADTIKIVQRLASDSALRTSLAAAAEDAAKSATTQPDAAQKLDVVVQKSKTLQLPLGWYQWPWEYPLDPRLALLKIFGLLISALAVSQGAPFWFDILSKVTNLRATGTPPGETKKGGAPTK